MLRTDRKGHRVGMIYLYQDSCSKQHSLTLTLFNFYIKGGFPAQTINYTISVFDTLRIFMPRTLKSCSGLLNRYLLFHDLTGIIQPQISLQLPDKVRVTYLGIHSKHLLSFPFKISIHLHYSPLFLPFLLLFPSLSFLSFSLRQEKK